MFTEFCKLYIDETAGNVEFERALGIGNLCPRDSSRRPRGRETMLPLLASFEQIAYPQVELRGVVEVIRGEIVWLEDREKLHIAQKNRIRAQIGCDLLGLILLDRCPSSKQVVVVGHSHLNRLIQ